MNNTIKLKNYLVEESNAYLIKNKGKVLMFSGKWGCGKTHF